LRGVTSAHSPIAGFRNWRRGFESGGRFTRSPLPPRNFSSSSEGKEKPLKAALFDTEILRVDVPLLLADIAALLIFLGTWTPRRLYRSCVVTGLMLLHSLTSGTALSRPGHAGLLRSRGTPLHARGTEQAPSHRLKENRHVASPRHRDDAPRRRPIIWTVAQGASAQSSIFSASSPGESETRHREWESRRCRPCLPPACRRTPAY
jgi:hypothetical protein